MLDRQSRRLLVGNVAAHGGAVLQHQQPLHHALISTAVLLVREVAEYFKQQRLVVSVIHASTIPADPRGLTHEPLPAVH